MKSFRLYRFCTIAVLCMLLPISAWAKSVSEQLTQLVDEIWQYELQSFPRLASRQGMTDYDDRLTDISAKALADRTKQFEAYLAALDKIDQTQLTQSQIFNIRIVFFVKPN